MLTRCIKGSETYLLGQKKKMTVAVVTAIGSSPAFTKQVPSGKPVSTCSFSASIAASSLQGSQFQEGPVPG